MQEVELPASAYRTLSPRALTPVLLTCEHASNRLPFPGRADGRVRGALDSHWGWDPGAMALTREVARRLGAAAVVGRWSRLLVDLNRPVSDPTLARREAGGVELPWNRRLSPRKLESRILTYHTPYHAEIDRLILRHLVRGVRPTLVAIHTFTPELNGRNRPFDAGVLFTDHAKLAYRIGKALRTGGLRVRYNEPYSGLAGMMYSVDRHGTHHGLTNLELEFNQALFDAPRAAQRLARVTARALVGLIDESGAAVR
jgi:predicted N-formylglutamate amidohydrolase